jgi:dihydrofolate reductase
MSRVIVIEFVSLDGVIEDPDGTGGTPQGGWAFRYGPELVAGDPFAVLAELGAGALLLGRRTWEQFAGIWPGRDDPFSAAMNAMPKLVASRSLERASAPGDTALGDTALGDAAWQNSAVVRGDLAAAVKELRQERDVIVMGSASVVRALMAADLVDEYRLLVYPLVLGEGARLFPGGTAPATLALAGAQAVGPVIRLTFTRPEGS